METVTNSGLRKKARRTWQHMIERCVVPGALGYRNYGGRGIRVCERWAANFEVFVADMGLPPSLAHSIDRIDNDGNYEPGNCRWATRAEQALNRRDTAKVWTGDAWEVLRIWAARVGIDYDYAYLCVHYWKWDAEKTLRAHAERLAKRTPATVAYLAKKAAERAAKAVAL